MMAPWKGEKRVKSVKAWAVQVKTMSVMLDIQQAMLCHPSGAMNVIVLLLLSTFTERIAIILTAMCCEVNYPSTFCLTNFNNLDQMSAFVSNSNVYTILHNSPDIKLVESYLKPIKTTQSERR